MKRTIEQWYKCNPQAMSEQSKNAIAFAFEDAQSDIIEMAKILRDIAYPARGSDAEKMDIQDFADLIQETFPKDHFDLI